MAKEAQSDCQLPHLGLATTRELIEELAARAETAFANGENWPGYSTMYGTPTTINLPLKRLEE